MTRRLAGRCYLCGDPCSEDGWFCRGHTWAGSLAGVTENGIKKLTRDHAFWIERLTPDQVVDLAAYLEVA